MNLCLLTAVIILSWGLEKQPGRHEVIVFLPHQLAPPQLTPLVASRMAVLRLTPGLLPAPLPASPWAWKVCFSMGLGPLLGFSKNGLSGVSAGPCYMVPDPLALSRGQDLGGQASVGEAQPHPRT